MFVYKAEFYDEEDKKIEHAMKYNNKNSLLFTPQRGKLNSANK